MRTVSRRTHAPALALVAVALAVALTGCSGDSGDGDSGGASNAAAAEAPAADLDAAYSVAEDESSGDEPAIDPEQRSVIRKGNVALRADDVGKAQFDVQKVVDEYSGRVTAEETTTDDDGEAAYTRMVLRIPSRSFDEAMLDLKAVPDVELDSANTDEDDVTTKVIDTRTRIEAQRRSIARITVLFDRAESIRDIMSIEAELSQRQADLDSLEQTAAYLAGQTTLSTIVVSIDQIPETKAETEPEEAGFVSGFKAGWDGLVTFAVGLATVLGALLPWLIALAILGPPVWLLVRAVRRRLSPSKSGRTPSAA